ncbi:MAG: Fe-S cluster assembly protein SufD [Bacteroidia bacterium]
MVTDKLTFTHSFLEELDRSSGKASFMPANEIGTALQYLEEKGIPNAKVEDYKYCNIEAILRKEFKAMDGKELAVADLKKDHFIKDAYNIYVVNGKLVSESETPEKGSLSAIDKAPADILKKHLGKYAPANGDALAALNAAYADRGFFLHITSVIEKPIVIHHITSVEGTVFLNTRNLVVIEKNSQATITEITYPSKGKCFKNSVTEIYVGEHAHCSHTMVQNAGETNHSVNTTKTNQETYSSYTNNVFTFSGALVRNNLSTAINGQFAEGHLNGLFITNGTQNVDNHTLVDHLKPNCQSNELYKGIVNGKSSATFNGQIFVERDAQKTNAYQSSKNILLSNDATVNAKPELEIYADDVKCSHGTSTGKVDENALFYLKSRGIGEESAKKLLLHAFAHEVISAVKTEPVQELVIELFEQSLAD